MKKFRIFSIVAVILVFVAWPVTPVKALTPDGQTPAEESVCDVLLDGTNDSLHGLCVAFCEAVDCDSLPALNTPCLRILNNFGKKANGVSMPCLGLNVEVFIGFYNPVGSVDVHQGGVTYYFNGVTWTQSQYYPYEIWGEYVLYLPGADANIGVDVTYNGPIEQVDLQVVTKAYVIVESDGSNGTEIATPGPFNITVNKGETERIDLMYAIPVEEKGLHRFIVKVYHEDDFILKKEGIYCPPDLESLE